MMMSVIMRGLNQSKSVSKHLFHSLPLTLTNNIINSNSSNTILLSQSDSPRFGKGWDNTFTFLTYDHHLNTINFHPLPPYSFLKLPSLRLWGHCLGIVCFSDGLYDIFLYNLITGKLHQLPPSDSFDHGGLTYPGVSTIGFGYDSKSKDLKVVRVVSFYLDPQSYYPNRVEVYDLSKNRWRQIQTLATTNVLWDPSFGMYHIGVHYWWALHKYNQILTFDFTNEIFDRIPVPESFGTWPVKVRTMGVWNGSIVLFRNPDAFTTSDKPKSFDVWAMKKDQSGWSKIFTIGPLSGVERPLLFVNSDLLLMKNNHRQLLSYNINTKEFNHHSLDICGINGFFIFANSFSHMKN